MKHGCRIEIWHKRTVWTALVMLIASFFIFPGCALLPKEETPLPPPLIKPVKVEYTTVDVKKQTLAEKIQGGAAFIYEKRSTILSKGTGNRLKALYIKLGNKVKVGDLIAEMDNDGILEVLLVLFSVESSVVTFRRSAGNQGLYDRGCQSILLQRSVDQSAAYGNRYRTVWKNCIVKRGPFGRALVRIS